MKQKFNAIVNILKYKLGTKNLKSMDVEFSGDNVFLKFKIKAMKMIINVSTLDVYKEKVLNGNNIIFKNDVTEILEDSLKDNLFEKYMKEGN